MFNTTSHWASRLELQRDTISQLWQWLKWEVNHTECWGGWRPVGTLTLCGKSAEWHNHFGKQFLIKLIIHIPYNAEISFLGVYPRDNKACVNPKICLWMLIACSLTRAPKGKQLNCPSVGECIRKPRCIHDAYRALLLSSKKKRCLDTCNNMGESWKHHGEWKTLHMNVWTLYGLFDVKVQQR